MTTELSLKEVQKQWHGTLSSYLIGFFISLLLTLASFGLVMTQLFAAPVTTVIVVGLALTQAICQLLFFLHLGKEAKPRWESLAFYFMLLVVFIVAFGTLWIINDLQGRVMTEMNKEMKND